MKCSRAQELIVEHEDGSLPPAVSSHVNECAACRAFASRSRTIRLLMSLKKYEKQDAEAEARSIASIHERLVEEQFNAASADTGRSFLDLLLSGRLPVVRYAVAALFVVLVSIHVMTMPTLSPIETLSDSTDRNSPAAALAAGPSLEGPRLPTLQTNMGERSLGVEYGPGVSVPVSLDY